MFRFLILILVLLTTFGCANHYGYNAQPRTPEQTQRAMQAFQSLADQWSRKPASTNNQSKKTHCESRPRYNGFGWLLYRLSGSVNLES